MRLPRTHYLVIRFAAAVMLLGTAPLSAAGPIQKFKNNGNFVEAYGTSLDGCAWFYLYIGKGGTAAAPTTNLHYNVYDFCTQQASSGGGQIDNAAFKATRTRASLTFTPTPRANFEVVGRTEAIRLTLADRQHTAGGDTSAHKRISHGPSAPRG